MAVKVKTAGNTEHNYENGKGIMVDGKNNLLVLDGMKKLAIIAPGSWTRAEVIDENQNP